MNLETKNFIIFVKTCFASSLPFINSNITPFGFYIGVILIVGFIPVEFLTSEILFSKIM